ncbi:MAG TPA: hypothetical protein VNW52_00770 [Burkholderiaceae bacterium]|jgi:hypothetical protein|nr:hypothetical protein [Burkholderiaceae bacterium]
MKWYTGKIIAGYGVASGRASDCPFPGGSIRQQQPYFLAQGVDLSPYFAGTLNVDLAPHIPHPAGYVFDGNLRWFGDLEEHFILSRVELTVNGRHFSGLWYYPDPATKVDHFQSASVVELLMPWIEGLDSGDLVTVRFCAKT